MSYGIADNSSVAYTNSSGVYVIRADKQGELQTARSHETLLIGRFIESVTILS
ncbi:MAG: hypothetical protein AAFQ89_03755 [Cyanobacteria bacterium J06626_18]